MSFNLAAATYDHTFTDAPLARWLRQRTWTWLDSCYFPGMRVLELGCGTGEDAVHLAQRGVDVIATDGSQSMLDITRQKAARVSVALDTQFLDLTDATTWQLNHPMDGVHSNFGALNCTDQWADLATWLAAHVVQGGKATFAVMGRYCLWETLWHGIHLDFNTAFRRWSGAALVTLPDGSQFPVYYPTADALIATFAPHFRLVNWRGLGVFLPPSDAFSVVEDRPRLKQRLIKLEEATAHHRGWRQFADHFWVELERI